MDTWQTINTKGETMHSQQKKVKWSRGETNSALEERTDTGVTEVSVAKLENIIADIYGNITRRPALKIISYDEKEEARPIGIMTITTEQVLDYPERTSAFVFSVTTDSYIIFITPDDRNSVSDIVGFFIENDKFVKTVKIDMPTGLSANSYGPVSVAQSNNYMVVGGLATVPLIFKLTETNDIKVEQFKFDAPWIAANNTDIKTIQAGLFTINYDGQGFTDYIYTSPAGNMTTYSAIDTGYRVIDPSVVDWRAKIERDMPSGSILHAPNMGFYMRIEGYYLSGQKCIMYGALLTPVADASKKDNSFTLEIGYTDTSKYNPQKFAFAQQRLYATHFKNTQMSPQVIPSFIAGSQIAKYTDFKNDYGAANEAISININTEYQEQMVSMIDFNGLKIFSDASEYTYDQANGIKKQSSNGIYNLSEPVIFKSILLYADKTKKNILAFQYELGQDIFQSSAINKLAQESLIYDPWRMVFNEDREHITGKYLYVIQRDKNKTPGQVKGIIEPAHIAVCNLSQETNNMSWARWTFPNRNTIYSKLYVGQISLITGAVAINNKVWFVIKNTSTYEGTATKIPCTSYTLAELDFEQKLDFETELKPTDEYATIIPQKKATGFYAWQYNGAYVYTEQEHPQSYNYAFEVYAYSDTISKSSSSQKYITSATETTITTIDGITYTKDPANYITDKRTFAWRNDDGDILYSKTQVRSGNTAYLTSKIGESQYNDLTIWPNGMHTSDGYIYWKSNTGSTAWADHDNLQIGERLSSNNEQTNSPIEAILEDGKKVRLANGYVFEKEYEREGYATVETSKGTQYFKRYPSKDVTQRRYDMVLSNTTIQVYDGDKYMWDDTTDNTGKLSKPLTALAKPKIGFHINAELESHPIDINGKTFAIKKRIAKAKAIVRDTEPNAFHVNDKTGYMSSDKKVVNFYGCSGMKDLVTYKIKNKQGAKFTIESLTLDLEYGTLD